MDLRLLLTSLEAIERVCTQEKAKSESSEKAANKKQEWQEATWYQIYGQSPQESPL